MSNNSYKTNKSITYSASGGIKLPDNDEFIKNALNNFSSISVREEHLAIELSKYTGIATTS